MFEIWYSVSVMSRREVKLPVNIGTLPKCMKFILMDNFLFVCIIYFSYRSFLIFLSGQVWSDKEYLERNELLLLKFTHLKMLITLLLNTCIKFLFPLLLFNCRGGGFPSSNNGIQSSNQQRYLLLKWRTNGWISIFNAFIK